MMRRKKAYDHTCFPYCGVSLRTVQFMAQNVDGCSTEMMYAALQLLHTDARESTVGAMMAGLDPNCGLCCEDSIRKVVWPLMQKTVEVLEGSWLTAREEWLHHPSQPMKNIKTFWWTPSTVHAASSGLATQAPSSA